MAQWTYTKRQSVFAPVYVFHLDGRRRFELTPFNKAQREEDAERVLKALNAAEPSEGPPE